MSKTVEMCNESGYRIEQDEYPKWDMLAGQPRYSVVSRVGDVFYTTNVLSRALGYLEATPNFKTGGEENEKKDVYADPHLGECLFGDSYGDVGKTLGKMACAINKANSWGFDDEELHLYRAAFGYMKHGAPVSTVIGCLPETKVWEELDEETKKTVTRLTLLLNDNPNLIRAYILERLEDANFHSEVRELIASVKDGEDGEKVEECK